jgi:hypothetical protein
VVVHLQRCEELHKFLQGSAEYYYVAHAELHQLIDLKRESRLRPAYRVQLTRSLHSIEILCSSHRSQPHISASPLASILAQNRTPILDSARISTSPIKVQIQSYHPRCRADGVWASFFLFETFALNEGSINRALLARRREPQSSFQTKPSSSRQNAFHQAKHPPSPRSSPIPWGTVRLCSYIL